MSDDMDKNVGKHLTDVPHGQSGLLDDRIGGPGRLIWTPVTQPTELRDYFAAKVLHAILVTVDGGPEESMGMARMAYHIADAMLKARCEQ